MLPHWGHRSGKAEADSTHNLFSLLCAPWSLSSSFSSFSLPQSLPSSSPRLPARFRSKIFFYPAGLRIKQLPIILQWTSKNLYLYLFYTDEQNKKVLEKGTARAPGTEAQRALGSISGSPGLRLETPAASLPCLESPGPKSLFVAHGDGGASGEQKQKQSTSNF